jgi:exosortase F-associated protein
MEKIMKTSRAIRLLVGLISGTMLMAVFIFQKWDVATPLGFETPLTNFIINRTVRFFINDIFALGLIYALFPQKKYMVFALWVQMLGVLFGLFPYFVLKVFFINYNGPLLSFLHRLILNPTLLLLLIPAFYYQERMKKTN